MVYCASLGLYFLLIFLLYIHVILFLMHLIIWCNCSKLQAVVYRHAVVELLHTCKSEFTPEQVTKAESGSRGIAILFL